MNSRCGNGCGCSTLRSRCRPGAGQANCSPNGINAALAARETAERLRAEAGCGGSCKCGPGRDPCRRDSGCGDNGCSDSDRCKGECRNNGCGNNNCGNNGCCPAQSLGEFLYGGSVAPPPVCVSCCDPGCCRCYCLADRNPYWPAFAHPRWLCCAELYDYC